MNKLISAVFGDGKNASPAKRYVIYAAIVTLFALVAALVVLGVSSIVFALTDTPADTLEEADGTGDGANTPVSTGLKYDTVTADELDEMVDGLVVFKSAEDRTIEGNNRYYGKTSGENKLSSITMGAVHNMMIDFYTANKSVLKTDIKAEDCNIPLIDNADESGCRFKIVNYKEEAIKNDKTYGWIFSNAHKYGFIYEDNSFTYVGVAAAKYLNGKGTLETLVTKLENNGKNVSVTATAVGASKAASYQIYYLSADAELKVPSEYEYTVLANGTNGYVITVNTSKKVATAQTSDAAAG